MQRNICWKDTIDHKDRVNFKPISLTYTNMAKLPINLVYTDSGISTYLTIILAVHPADLLGSTMAPRNSLLKQVAFLFQQEGQLGLPSP